MKNDEKHGIFMYFSFQNRCQTGPLAIDQASQQWTQAGIVGNEIGVRLGAMRHDLACAILLGAFLLRQDGHAPTNGVLIGD